MDDSTAELTLTADNYSLFVWLDLNGLEGVFSKNGFHMLEKSTIVTFKSKYPLTANDLNKITVTWLKKTYPE